MSARDKFTEEEWRALLRAPMLVSYAVAGASPSDEEGFVREMSAVADAVVEGGQGAAAGSLLGEVVADIVAYASDEHRGQTERIPVGEIKGRALENCRAVDALLRTKAGAEEADAYRRWLLDVAYRVAAAAKEGGLFGLGGEQVSRGEAATIDEIAAALGARS